jgi:pimeloyl-ACP methyl ester carboxylesterase
VARVPWVPTWRSELVALGPQRHFGPVTPIMFDPISGAHMVAHFREFVPKAKVTELNGIGHYPQVQVPREVLAAYLSFRDEVEANLAVTNKSSAPGKMN